MAKRMKEPPQLTLCCWKYLSNRWVSLGSSTERPDLLTLMRYTGTIFVVDFDAEEGVTTV